MSDGKESSTIDFSKMSQGNLVAALERINREKYPANYAACMAEIEKRKAEGRWIKTEPATASGQPAPPKVRPQFSAKRRLFAYLADEFFVAILATAFFPLSNLLNHAGIWGTIPFWIFSFGYFVWFEGPKGKGQTPGKALLNLRVVGKDGAPLTWKQALIRGAGLMLPGLSNYGIHDLSPTISIAELIGSLWSAFWLLNIVFLVMHRQRRSLVDLISGTLVHDKDAPVPEFAGGSAIRGFAPLIAGAVSIAVIWTAITLWVPLFGPEIDVTALRADIEAHTKLQLTQAGTFKFYKNGSLVASGTNFFFWLPPDLLTEPGVVQEESKKAREIIMARNQNGALGSVNVVVAGHSFTGLLPVAQTFRNYDLNNYR